MVKYLRDIDNIFVAGNQQMKTKSDLVKFIEAPCLPVCEELYDKNILTCWSSANKHNPKEAFVAIRYEFLDEANKKIAKKLATDGIIKQCYLESFNSSQNQYGLELKLSVPTHLDMPVDEISAKLKKLSANFVYQDIKYNIYTPTFLQRQNPFWKGIDFPKEYCFPDLKNVIFAPDDLLYEDIGNNRFYDALRLSIPLDRKLTADDMKKIAGKIGWIYNPNDGLLYKDAETLRRHNEYLKYKNAQMALQNQQIETHLH